LTSWPILILGLIGACLLAGALALVYRKSTMNAAPT
jgi:hypothetical protein